MGGGGGEVGAPLPPPEQAPAAMQQMTSIEILLTITSVSQSRAEHEMRPAVCEDDFSSIRQRIPFRPMFFSCSFQLARVVLPTGPRCWSNQSRESRINWYLGSGQCDES